MKEGETIAAPLYTNGLPLSVGRIKFSDEYHGIDIVAHLESNSHTKQLIELLEIGVATGVDISPKLDPSVTLEEKMSVFNIPEPKVTIDEDKFISHWAGELKKIYDNQTAGDYTFEGVVSKMLRDFTTPPQCDILINGKWETK